MGENIINNASNQSLRENSSRHGQAYLRVARLTGWLLGLGLLITPLVFVIQDRWLDKTDLRDIYRAQWCRWDFLCKTQWPSYFLVIIPAFVLFIALFLWKASRQNERFGHGELASLPDWLQIDADLNQKGLANYLLELAGVIGLASSVIAIVIHRLPGVEILLAVLLALFSRWLAAVPWETIVLQIRSAAIRLVPLGIGQIVLIFFLRSLAVDHQSLPVTAILLVVTFAYLVRTVKPALIYWIVCGGLVLMTLGINSWQFSTIGDEYNFYTFALERFQPGGFKYILENFFNGTGVYHSHPMFSTTLQVASMALFGRDGFGWRISSVYLAAASSFFFYEFFKNFLSQRVALWAAFFLAASQYLFNFAKIGYNNPEALFALGLVLWAGAETARRRSPLSYAGLGAAIGLCFYVYPGALYAVPLPVLLLLLYDPPKARSTRTCWANLAFVLVLLISPLFFQPDYWAEKLPGTFLNNPQISSFAILLENISTNFLYSVFSYLYSVQETHYVVGAYLDPICAFLLPIGLAWTLLQTRRNKFALFAVVTYLLFLVLVGSTSGREAPATTRMFLLLPWYTLFSALGLDWVFGEIGDSLGRLNPDRSRRFEMGGLKVEISFDAGHYRPIFFTGLVLVSVLAANIYMAYGLERQRTQGAASLEVLFLRVLQRAQAMDVQSPFTYLFITNDSWGIDGLMVYPEVFHVPQSVTQLRRVAVSQPSLPEEYAAIAADPYTAVVVQPGIETGLQEQIYGLLQDIGKSPCAVRDIPTSDIRFYMFLDPDHMDLCPVDGNWN
jgi:hypothetical protein